MPNVLGPDIRGSATRPERAARGATDTWFKDCVGGDPLTGTAFERDFFNDMLAQFRSFINKSGQSTAVYSDDFLTRSGRKGFNYAVAGGSANTLTVTLDPVPIVGEITAGFTLRVLIATGNTGAATLNPNGLGATAITRPNGAALRQGDLVPGQIATFIFTGTGWMMSNPGAADVSVGGTTLITAVGTVNFIVPANVFRLKEIIVIGGGGGGGGGQNATTFSGAGSGGAAGGASIKFDLAVTPGQSISTTVGVGGTAGTSSLNGGNGGSSSVGAFCSATGGTGGVTASGGTVAGGIGSSGDINIQGADAGTAVISSGPQPKGGDGANGPLGYGGGGSGTITTAGLSAQGRGAGGGGGGQNQNGGVGSAGLIIIRY